MVEVYQEWEVRSGREILNSWYQTNKELTYGLSGYTRDRVKAGSCR